MVSFNNKNRLVGLFLLPKDRTVKMMEITRLLNQNWTADTVQF